MTPAEALTKHKAVTDTLCGLHESLATLEAHIETVWVDAYLRSSATSASGRENDARAATRDFRAEAIRLRGSIASAEARERFLARALAHYDRTTNELPGGPT